MFLAQEREHCDPWDKILVVLPVTLYRLLFLLLLLKIIMDFFFYETGV
jgi:hypothetical protein